MKNLRGGKPGTMAVNEDQLEQILGNPDCAGRVVMGHVTSRWGLLAMLALTAQPLRFHQLRDRIAGVSEKMLSQTLKLLVDDRLVDRLVEPKPPVQVTYRLTELGARIAAPLEQLVAAISGVVGANPPGGVGKTIEAI